MPGGGVSVIANPSMRRARPGHPRIAAAVVMSMAGWAISIGPAVAGEWTFTPGVSVSEEYSDNANLANDEDPERNSDLITTISPGISIAGTGGRVNLNLDYSLNQVIFKNGTGNDQLRNNLAATGRIELWDRVFFLEGQASIARQVVDNAAADTDTAAGENSDNRTTTKNFNITPVFLHHFGTWMETESRTSYEVALVEANEVSNTRTLSSSFVANSGRRFQRLQWAVSLNQDKTIRDGGSPSSKTLNGNVNLTYVWSRMLSLFSDVGYERIDDDTLTNKPRGIIWDVGFLLNPGPRTSLRFSVGDRFDTTTYSFEGSHQLSSRTSITASFNQSIEITTNQTNDDLSFVIVGPNGGLIDSRTRLPFDPSTSEFGLQDDAVRTKTFRLNFNGSRRRNSFNGGVNWRSQKTDATGVEEIVYGANLNFSRTLTPRTTASVNASYEVTDFGNISNREDYQVSAGFQVSYQINENTNANFNFSHTERGSTDETVEFRENAVTVNLSRSF